MPGFTKQAILRTFGEMLEEKPFDKIKVSDLVKACGISHNTFYYHYQDIYDLLDAWLLTELGPYLRDDSIPAWENSLKEILLSCRERSRTVYHIFDSLSRDRLERYVFTAADDMIYRYVALRAEGRPIPEARLREISDFCRYAFCGYFLRFLWNGMADDLDRSVDAFCELLSGFVEQALEASGEALPDGEDAP